MHKIFSNLQPTRRWQTRGQGPAKNKQQRILTRRPVKRSYEKTVSAFLEQTVTSCQKTYSRRSESRDTVTQADTGSEEDPPPLIENIVLEERTLTEEQREFSLESFESAHEEIEGYAPVSAARYYSGNTDCSEESLQSADPARAAWDELMLKREYKGIQTDYLPDEEKLGKLKIPNNLGDVIDMKVAIILDL